MIGIYGLSPRWGADAPSTTDDTGSLHCRTSCILSEGVGGLMSPIPIAKVLVHLHLGSEPALAHFKCHD